MGNSSQCLAGRREQRTVRTGGQRRPGPDRLEQPCAWTHGRLRPPARRFAAARCRRRWCRLRALAHLSRRLLLLPCLRPPPGAPGRPAAAPSRVVGPACGPMLAAPRAARPARHLAAAGRQPRRTSRRAQSSAASRSRCRRRRMPNACSSPPATASRNSACWPWRRDAACCSTGIRWASCGMCWCRKRARPTCASAHPTMAGCRPSSRAAAKSAWCRPPRACTGCGSTRSTRPSGWSPCWPRRWSPRPAPCAASWPAWCAGMPACWCWPRWMRSWPRGRNTNAARCRCPAGAARSATTASWPGCTTTASCCGVRARRRASCPGPIPGCRASSLAARP
jgi:hypothetical protein